jgi:hypothetical protein
VAQLVDGGARLAVTGAKHRAGQHHHGGSVPSRSRRGARFLV